MFKAIKIKRLVKEYNEVCSAIARNPNGCEGTKKLRAELAEKIEKLRK